MQLEGKVVFLSGAASGLGRELARRLAAKGCRLLLVDRDAAGLEALRHELGSAAARSLPCDLSDPPARARLVEQIHTGEQRLHLVVHCAGVGSHSRLEQLGADEIGPLMQTNTLAPLELTAGLLPLLPPDEPAGLVFIGSLAGELGTPGMSLYSASKAAVHAFSRAAAAELAGQGHFSLLVILGALRGTRFVDSIRHPASGQPGWYRRLDVDPSRAAARIVRAIEQQRTQLVIPGWYGGLLTLGRLFSPLTQAITRVSYRTFRGVDSPPPA